MMFSVNSRRGYSLTTTIEKEICVDLCLLFAPVSDEGRDAAVVAGLALLREKAAGQLAAALVEGHALAADALARAGLVGAGAVIPVLGFVAFHGQPPLTKAQSHKVCSKEEEPWCLCGSVRKFIVLQRSQTPP
jgi:hypothetical protein